MDKRKIANAAVKKKMEDAFFALLSEKPFSEITVTDLVTRAGVARASYYRNYESMEDIVRQYLAQLQSEMQNELGGQAFRLGEKAPRDCVTVPLNYYIRERERFLLLFDFGFEPLLLKTANYLGEVKLGDMPYHSVQKYRIYFITGAILNVLLQWLKGNCRESVDDMADLLLELINGILCEKEA